MSEFAEGLAVGMNENNRGYNNGWGNGFGDGWWILLLLLCGWGNNGWGGNNNQNVGYELGKVATTNDVAAGFNNSAVLSKLNDITLGQTQGFAGVQQTMCQGFSGVNQSLMQGFHGVDNALCTLGYQTQQGFNDTQRQMSDCCCKIERGIDSVNFNAERNACDIKSAIFNSTRDIIDSQRYGTDRIITHLTNQEMDRLRSRVQALETEKSIANQNAYITANQAAQTAELVRRLGADCPQPSFLVNPPTPVNFPTNSCGQVQFNNGCGCGC